jgi:hypothetical protein
VVLKYVIHTWIWATINHLSAAHQPEIGSKGNIIALYWCDWLHLAARATKDLTGEKTDRVD